MTAAISPCGKYRYRLDRGPKNGGGWSRPVFIGVNPSTADATQDDATIRKLKGFLQRWGMQPTFTIINLFSYRATDVRELATCEHPKGLDHDYYVNEAINDAGMLIPCWGDQTKLPLALRGEIDTMLRRVRNSEKPVYVFGRTKLGDPMHPLMLPYSTNMVPFK